MREGFSFLRRQEGWASGADVENFFYLREEMSYFVIGGERHRKVHSFVTRLISVE